MNLDQLTPQQLRQAANLKERIESLQKELNGILGETKAPTPESTAKPKRKLSAKGRANIRAGVRARMARQNAEKAGKSAQPKPTPPARTKKARVKRVDQSDAVIAMLKQAKGRQLSKQEIVRQIKDFKPNSWFLTMASAKKKGVKQQGDKAQATYSV